MLKIHTSHTHTHTTKLEMSTTDLEYIMLNINMKSRGNINHGQVIANVIKEDTLRKR